MSDLRLRLLGAPKLVGALTVPLDRKLAGVLAYLALEGATPRALLADLLWTKAPSERARQSLRQALQRLHPLTNVFASSDPLRFSESVTVDLMELRGALTRGEIDLSESQPTLLEGLEFDDCPEFADWLRMERERLQEWRRDALRQSAERLERAGSWLEALQVAGRWLQHDPVSEVAHRQVMRLHDALGDRAAALRAFEHCVDVLNRELNLVPLPETQQLAERIGRGDRLKAGTGSQPTSDLQLKSADPLALEVRLVRATKLMEDGNRPEARQLALNVLESSQSTATSHRASLIVAQSLILEGQFSEAVSYLEVAATSREAGLRLRALINLGSVASRLHGPAQGVPLFQRALQIAQSLGETGSVALLHNNLAAGAVRLGGYAEAQRHQEQAIAQLERSTSPGSLAQLRANLAHLNLLRGGLAQALENASRATLEAERSGSLPPMASAAFALGLAQRRVGDSERARASLKRALAIHLELNDPRSAAVLEFNLAALALEQNADSSDAGLFATGLSALERLEITGDAALIAVCNLELALLSADPAQRGWLADRGLERNTTSQTRMLHAVAHLSAASKTTDLEPLIANLTNSLEPYLHETGLAHAALYSTLSTLEPRRARAALEGWRTAFELETRGLSEVQRQGRLRYYARRVPAETLSALAAQPRQLTPT